MSFAGFVSTLTCSAMDIQSSEFVAIGDSLSWKSQAIFDSRPNLSNTAHLLLKGSMAQLIFHKKMARQLVWLEDFTFAAWGCSDDALGFWPILVRQFRECLQ
jgi:hypothetical protein